MRFSISEQRDGETTFPGTILHQSEALAQNKTQKEDNRSAAALQNGRICETHPTHVGLQRANTSQILRLRQYQVKNSVGFGY